MEDTSHKFQKHKSLMNCNFNLKNITILVLLQGGHKRSEMILHDSMIFSKENNEKFWLYFNIFISFRGK